MFPLGSVLFPHQPLPLHVFEQRYRALVRDCLGNDRTFGVVLIERGSEVGGGDVRFDVGCTAMIVEAEELPDGHWLLDTVGGQRLRVERWLDDDPYPQAEVEVLEEAAWTEVDERAFDAAVDGFRRVLARAAQLGLDTDAGVLELPGEASWDHWLLAARAPLGDLDRLAVLAAETPAARLDLLREHLDELEAVLAHRLGGG